MAATRTRPLDAAGVLASPRVLYTLEAVAVLASPLMLYLLLRLRGMAPVQLPDPSMHTTFIVDPHDIFARYQEVFTPTARLREAARVGFLVPARITYLLFGLVPGFFVLRYVFALVTIVPSYLLLKRLYGRWAGWLGIVVLMSSPVLITTWGTDYPDSAAVSYLTGGLAAMAMSFEGSKGRRGWLILAGALLTLAVWSHGIAVPLVASAGVVYLGARCIQDRLGAGRDLIVLAAVAVFTTVFLAVGSKLLIGQFNFVTPTIRAEQYLSSAAQERLWHSSSWRWAPYDVYLLVPPVVVGAFLIVLAGRWRRLNVTRLFLGVTGALQLLVFLYLQFLGKVQALEMHYLSSTLWSSVNLLLIVLLAELALPLRGSRLLRWMPAVGVLVVALIYEAANSTPPSTAAVFHGVVPTMTWFPRGLVVVAIAVGASLVGRAAISFLGRSAEASPIRRVVLAVLAILGTYAAVLVLTVAPNRPHPAFVHTVYDPPPAYAAALGGRDTAYVDQYVVSARLPAFVGHPAYRNEQLLTWWPQSDGYSGAIIEPMGIFHSWFNLVSLTFPRVGPLGLQKIESRHVAQVLLMGTSDSRFPEGIRALRLFEPTIVRRAVLSDNLYHLHVWLVDLGRYLREPGRTAARMRPPNAHSPIVAAVNSGPNAGTS